MIKKITLMVLFLISASIYGQTTIIHDFEAGSPTIRTEFGSSFSIVANPDTSDNSSANVGRCARTGIHWYELINFPLATPFVIPANETRYLHVLVKGNNQTDIP